MAVQCLQIVQEKIEENNAFNPVLKKVLRCLPEIVADHEFIASVLSIKIAHGANLGYKLIMAVRWGTYLCK